MQEQVVRNDGGADEADGGHKAGGVICGQLRREHAGDDGAPIGVGGKRGDQEHHAHEYDDGREHLFDEVVVADEHHDGCQQAHDNDDGAHGNARCDGLDAQNAAGDVAGFIGDVADENSDNDDRDSQALQHGIGNAVANVLAQALLAGDADAGGHFLEDDGGDGGEHEGPQHGVADARARNGARGNRAGADEARGHESTRANVLELFDDFAHGVPFFFRASALRAPRRGGRCERKTE